MFSFISSVVSIVLLVSAIAPSALTALGGAAPSGPIVVHSSALPVRSEAKQADVKVIGSGATAIPAEAGAQQESEEGAPKAEPGTSGVVSSNQVSSSQVAGPRASSSAIVPAKNS